MNLSKYDFLYDFIPSLKEIIENKKLTLSQKKSLDVISRFYNKEPLESNNKKILRKKLKLLKSNISFAELKKRSLLLNEKVINTKEFKKAKSVFCYISFEDEIDTFNILEDCLKSNKILSVPVIKNNRIMISAIITSLDDLEKNKYGILEPINYKTIDKKDIDLAIKILQQSIENSWQGIFPLKEKEKDKKVQEHDPLKDAPIYTPEEMKAHWAEVLKSLNEPEEDDEEIPF